MLVVPVGDLRGKFAVWLPSQRRDRPGEGEQLHLPPLQDTGGWLRPVHHHAGCGMESKGGPGQVQPPAWANAHRPYKSAAAGGQMQQELDAAVVLVWPIALALRPADRKLGQLHQLHGSWQQMWPSNCGRGRSRAGAAVPGETWRRHTPLQGPPQHAWMSQSCRLPRSRQELARAGRSPCAPGPLPPPCAAEAQRSGWSRSPLLLLHSFKSKDR